MRGANCALFGCSTSRKSGESRRGDREETAILKNNARKEWLRVILRTREMTPDLKQRIEKNEIYLCERHFKVEFIVDRKY